MALALVLSISLVMAMAAVTVGSSPQGSSPAQRARRWVHGLTLFNLLVFMLAIGLGLVWLCAPSVVQAAGPSEQEGSAGDPYASFAAALAAGVACIAAGFAVSSTGSAAIGTIAERPETFGRALIFVGLAEGIAIYGLIVAFMILGR